MTPAPLFADWNWEDPDALTPVTDAFTANLAQCEKLERLAVPLPVTRQDFLSLGLTGIEFAAFKTRHPSGLGTDRVGLHSKDAGTQPGHVFRVDDESYFTELDVCEPLPFGAACVDWVYAEHLIEHITLPVAVGWLSEVRRILAPGGLLRLTTPDLRRYTEDYVNDGGFFGKHRRRLSVMGVGPPMPERRAFMFNQLFYHYGHRWIYDADELRHVLCEAGFDQAAIRVCGFRQGERPDVAGLDTNFRRNETIYVEVNA